MIEEHSIELLLGGRTLSFSTGKIAKQASGSVLVSYGDSRVLVTAVMDKKDKENIDFFPLTVDYREYTYAVGRIPGGFFKREGRPTDNEVLTSRLIDRPIRPLFPDGFKRETQIIAMVMSADGINSTDIMAINGTSLALGLSDIPFSKLIGAVRVGLIDGNFIVNPISEIMEKSLLNLIIAGTSDAIVMVEAGAGNISESLIIQALEFGHREIKRIILVMEDLVASCGKKKLEVIPPQFDQNLITEIEQKAIVLFKEAISIRGKLSMYSAIDKVVDDIVSFYPEEDEKKRAEAALITHDILVKTFRQQIIGEGKRTDGRAFDEIRNIWCEIGVLPRVHGSAIFTRGETQALVTCTLGSAIDVQRLSGLFEGEEKRFMLHYNFPPFSVGEVKPIRGPGRREVGHGALAERAILPFIPGEATFPYTIRIVSDILESNGSSSQATICGATLALMDAGVPIKEPVAGIAMGLIMDGEKIAILSDIAGLEDHYGDMDFKVAGTTEGITALQMDIKIGGISFEIMAKALEQAKVGRLYILEKMKKIIAAPRPDISPLAPRIYSLTIPKAKIGELIGPGGKNIRAIIEETGAEINIEDDGSITVASADAAAAEKAIKLIKLHTEIPEVGKTYKGTVKRIEAYGAFVEIIPGVDGLLHISEIDYKRVGEVRDVLKEGDQLDVKLIERDESSGKLRLSRKALLEKPEGVPDSEESPKRHKDFGNRRRGPGDRGHKR